MRPVVRGIVWTGVLGVLLWPSVAAADVIRLTNGGELRGTISGTEQSPDETQRSANDGPVSIKTLSGATVVVDRDQIEFATRRPVILEHYEVRAQQTADTVEAQWALAEWCREHNLESERKVHLERVIELDPDHEKAHHALGHTKHNGEWTTRDAVMKAQGYVKYKGRYVTPQELEIIKKSAAERKAEQAWYPKVRLWQTWLTGRDPDRRNLGLANLKAINDPDAVTALAHFLSDDSNKAVRGLYVKILGQIPGIEPVAALVKQSLFDADYEVRYQALNALSPEQYEAAMPLYVRALQDEKNAVVVRAADALRRIGDERAVPNLIDALVTTHRYQIRVPSSNQFNLGFGTNGTFANPGQVPLPPDVEAALRTGQLPQGVIVLPPQVPTLPQKARVVTVERTYKNSEVLSALKTLTGKSFGYDERTWRLWWASQKSQVGGTP